MVGLITWRPEKTGPRVHGPMSARLRLALLATWTGLMLGSGLLFSRIAFQVLPGAVLGLLDPAGAALAFAAAALGLASARETGGKLDVFRSGIPLIGALAHVISYCWISPELHALREAAGGSIGTFAAGDPQISAFERLHTLSIGLFMLAASSALISSCWEVFSGRQTQLDR